MWAVFLLYLWGLVELGSWVGLWALQRYKGIEYVPAQLQTLITKHRVGIEGHLKQRRSYMVPDAELGWVVAPKRNKRGYRSNRDAIRADREYAATPPPGVLRIAAFGDSFTHASDVANPVTWEARLEALDPKIEMLNFGVPGYGPDQAFLRYQRDGRRLHPHVVFIGFMSENVGRMVNTFRPFYFPNSGMAFGKPRFELDGAGVRLVPNPLPHPADYRRLLADPQHELPRVGGHDYYYQRRSQRSRFDFLPSVRLAWVLRERFDQPIERDGVYNEKSEAFEVSVRVVEAFYRQVLADGSLPVVVVFPQRRDLRAKSESEPPVYAPLLAAFKQRGLLTLDLMGAFDRYDPQHTLVKKKFIHYPPEGNEWVARYIDDWLRENRLATVDEVRARLEQERQRRGASP
ncbi:MAG TPA: SGNH/GDSL hydrolase family protein [Thermoanaerobaculia bacterium]|nr:SGNH/GDSL hydrolase family protein [Thermoanaerobaculia bacterium]